MKRNNYDTVDTINFIII